MKQLKVAFVGMKRAPSEIGLDYFSTFVKYHLELPWYYAKFANISVDLVVTEDVVWTREFKSDGNITTITENQYKTTDTAYDAVIHWRKWHKDLFSFNSRNFMLCQDHSFSDEWKRNTKDAAKSGELNGILVFPGWHKENTARELDGIITKEHLYDGLTLGVDTQTYTPGEKDPYHLLWASDPGRGLDRLIPVFLKLYSFSSKFKLTVTCPDYVKPEQLARYQQFFNYPGVTFKPLKNGPELWNLFNTCGILPYTSTFPEPSSRCHRQAQAAGCVVLYPPFMGTPSQQIDDDETGFVRPISEWPELIRDIINSGDYKRIGQNARDFAVSENWEVQAQRFYNFLLRNDI